MADSTKTILGRGHPLVVVHCQPILHSQVPLAAVLCLAGLHLLWISLVPISPSLTIKFRVCLAPSFRPSPFGLYRLTHRHIDRATLALGSKAALVFPLKPLAASHAAPPRAITRSCWMSLSTSR